LVCENRNSNWNVISKKADPLIVNEDMFELTKKHDQLNLPFSYILVPGIKLDNFTAYNADSIQIIENSKTIQAIYHKKHNIYALAFYQPQKVKLNEDLSLVVDNPCLIMIDLDSGFKLYVSDPSHKFDNLNFDIICKGKRIKRNVSLPKSPDRGGTTKVEIDFD